MGLCDMTDTQECAAVWCVKLSQ